MRVSCRTAFEKPTVEFVPACIDYCVVGAFERYQELLEQVKMASALINLCLLLQIFVNGLQMMHGHGHAPGQPSSVEGQEGSAGGSTGLAHATFNQLVRSLKPSYIPLLRDLPSRHPVPTPPDWYCQSMCCWSLSGMADTDSAYK